MKTKTHPVDRCRRRFAYALREIAKLEKQFDAFIRRNMDNEEARKAFAETANKRYFELREMRDKAKRLWVHHKLTPSCWPCA